ncbi:hypothetical protein PgNI_11413 [Pyricularia grisea]|uniref:Uncharacterized protein n=1 Tax=Pyricularia grisea TaxID=148305 RepID=A0A6P8AQ58_PYRGI|nr:hypothetical protein PgNI_11413 [Pyricularia grisea]TLD04165.1 hypothetical protein PgNI_11413 [Pyricularia grisea]
MKPIYELCASLDIPPPPNGRLHLGCVLTNVGTTTRDAFAGPTAQPRRPHRHIRFAPSGEYLARTLDHGGVLRYLQLTRGEKPLYVVTGFKCVVGATLVGKGAERRGLGVAVPAQAWGEDEGGVNDFGGQKAFLLGYRTLRMTWAAKEKMDSRTQKSELLDMENWKIEEDIGGPGEIVGRGGGYGNLG